jgi:hypothetical protein
MSFFQKSVYYISHQPFFSFLSSNTWLIPHVSFFKISLQCPHISVAINSLYKVDEMKTLWKMVHLDLFTFHHYEEELTERVRSSRNTSGLCSDS